MSPQEAQKGTKTQNEATVEQYFWSLIDCHPVLCNFASCLILESHNLEIDLDLAADLAQLKKNLAKMRKGKMGKGLHDVLIEEFDWVNTSIYASLKNTCSKYFIQQMQNNRRVKAVTIFLYETSL